MEIKGPSYTIGRIRNWYSHYGKEQRDSQKTKTKQNKKNKNRTTIKLLSFTASTNSVKAEYVERPLELEIPMSGKIKCCSNNEDKNPIINGLRQCR